MKRTEILYVLILLAAVISCHGEVVREETEESDPLEAREANSEEVEGKEGSIALRLRNQIRGSLSVPRRPPRPEKNRSVRPKKKKAPSPPRLVPVTEAPAKAPPKLIPVIPEKSTANKKSDTTTPKPVRKFFGPPVPAHLRPAPTPRPVTGRPWFRVPSIPTNGVSMTELQALRKKYMKIRAELSGLTMKDEADRDYLAVLDDLSPETLELLDYLLEEDEVDDYEADVISSPGLTADALSYIDGILGALPAAVSSIVIGNDDDLDDLDDDGGDALLAPDPGDADPAISLLESPVIVLGGEAELATDTVSAVGSLVTSALTSQMPSLDDIHTMSSVITRMRERYSSLKKHDYYKDFVYTMQALREYMDNMDWMQGLAVILAIEARTAYDPYFRLSFPKILQQSKWFLPKKMYKLIPRYRPYRPPVPLVKAHFTVPRNDEERKKKLDKKKNKKNYFRKLVGLRRMGTAGSRLRGQGALPGPQFRSSDSEPRPSYHRPSSDNYKSVMERRVKEHQTSSRTPQAGVDRRGEPYTRRITRPNPKLQTTRRRHVGRRS